MATFSSSSVRTEERRDLHAALRAIYGDSPVVAEEGLQATPGIDLAPKLQDLVLSTVASDDKMAQTWWLWQTYGDGEQLAAESGVQKTLPERLAALLLEQYDVQGPLFWISHAALADQLGTHRENVSAIVRAFRRQGLIELGYRRIRIVDYAGLAEIADI